MPFLQALMQCLRPSNPFALPPPFLQYIIFEWYNIRAGQHLLGLGLKYWPNGGVIVSQTYPTMVSVFITAIKWTNARLITPKPLNFPQLLSISCLQDMSDIVLKNFYSFEIRRATFYVFQTTSFILFYGFKGLLC